MTQTNVNVHHTSKKRQSTFLTKFIYVMHLSFANAFVLSCSFDHLQLSRRGFQSRVQDQVAQCINLAWALGTVGSAHASHSLHMREVVGSIPTVSIIDSLSVFFGIQRIF